MNITQVPKTLREYVVQTREYSSLAPHMQSLLVNKVKNAYQHFHHDISGHEVEVMLELERQIKLIAAPLKLMTHNICGVGQLKKVKSLIEMDLGASCTVVQETKHLKINWKNWASLRGRRMVHLKAQNRRRNHSGGWIILYDPSVLILVSTDSTTYTLSATFQTVLGGYTFTIANIYCQIKDKAVFWEEMETLAEDNTDICFVGDYNATRDNSERRTVARYNNNRPELNTFIGDYELG